MGTRRSHRPFICSAGIQSAEGANISVCTYKFTAGRWVAKKGDGWLSIGRWAAKDGAWHGWLEGRWVAKKGGGWLSREMYG
jgi:hypothetical protein